MIGCVTLTEQLFKQLKNIYGDFSPIRLAGGYTNATFLLDGTQPLLVAKVSNVYSQDIDNEVNCLKLIHETGIAPKFYQLFKINENQINVMEYRNGENGQSILDSNNAENAKELYISLGENLAKNIHSKKYNSSSNGIKECDLHDIKMNLDFVPTELINKSKLILRKVNDSKQNWVLTHGDFGVHNVLYTEDNVLTVLDWEWSEWANPLNDVGWVCWFTKLHYPEQANSLNSLFIEQYKANSPILLSSESLKGYCVYKVWKILHKIKKAPLEVKQEWVRRLEWTIETDIFDFIK
ncbi:aminoglycoside phosphotransferase family protein [Lysinibacillus antri]|uniref:Aminoglycoside phosphotransferase family protein n=1 Tax=Lysinibacillus antri TaxID=2498145 RepID=A0A3S0RI28_9BACI|nr:aminoglycoside phosphotransferase family protein [Lysinibacillus antri]